MDLHPLCNSLRVAAIRFVIVFFLGIFFAQTVSKLPRAGRIRGHEHSRGPYARPLSAIDSYLRRRTELLEGFPGTALLVTHSREEERRLCRTVTVLDHGTGEGSVPVQTLFRAPETLSACLLSGCENYSRVEPLSDGRVRAVDWGAELSCAAQSCIPNYAAIRAHHIELADSPGENVIPCRVLRVMEDVVSVIVMAAMPGGDTVEERLRLEPLKETWARRNTGETLYFCLPPERNMLLKGG